ncbi:Adhesion G protein-coupled receptor F5 [Bienertia sinuspersici]
MVLRFVDEKVKMINPQLSWFYTLAVLLALSCTFTKAEIQDNSRLKSAVFLSPEFVLNPGSVINKFYHNIDFPRGHIGIKNFNAEVVDEAGVPVSLQDTYLHHWVVARYYLRKDSKDTPLNSKTKLLQRSDFKWVRNDGVCDNLGQYFGLGSETRKTDTHVPDPYAIEVGNPDEVPPGYEERWLLNVHAIDTRGAVDRLGCTECKCSLYNVTVDEYGRHIRPDYEGGLWCCYDETRCKVKEGFQHAPRKLYLRYSIEWIDWDDKSLLPVKIYIFDVTDTWKPSNGKHQCKIEYEVNHCDSLAMATNGCIDTMKTSFNMPRGGYVVYGVAHQHAGGIGSALYRKDGGVICSSTPTYGKGNEPGNEAGYIVGMSTCYPDPGSLKIQDGETLVLESNYSSTRKHTGVMGLFYILVAEELPRPKAFSII